MNNPISESADRGAPSAAQKPPAGATGRKLRSDRKQLGALGLLTALVVAAGLAAFRGGSPHASAALPDASAMAARADFTPVSDSSIEPARATTTTDIDRTVDSLSTSAGKDQIPLTQLKVNPFRASPCDAAAEEAQGAAFTARAEAERKAVLLAVQSLRLESIQHGASRPSCLINNMVFQEGQEADGFFIEEIAADTVIVRKGAYRFELKVP